jgi:YHS domain-containing protein
MGLEGPTQYQGESAGQHFFFCSSECQRKFEKEPGLYLHKATGGHQHGGPQS